MKIIFIGLILLLNGNFVAGAPPADRSNSTSMTNELPTSDGGDTSMEGPATGEDLSTETEPPTMEPTEQSTPDVEASTMDTEEESASTSESAMEPSQTSEDPRESSLASEASESPKSSDTFTESSQPPMQSSSPSEASTASKENTEATESSLGSEASPPSEVPTKANELFSSSETSPSSGEPKETTESPLSSETPASVEPTETTTSPSASESTKSEEPKETTESPSSSEAPSSENPTETTDYSSAYEAPSSGEPIETTPAETTMEFESTLETETASSETPEPETSPSEMPTIGPIEKPPVSTEGEETMETTSTAVVVETSTTYCKYVFTPVNVAPTEDADLRNNKSHEVASSDAMATRREVLLKYKLLDKNPRADVGDGETEIGPGNTVKHQPNPDAVEIMMKKYREKAANGGELEAKLLKIKGVEKYFARDVRGNRNKYCLFSIVYQLRDAQGPVVKMMPVGISMNPEVADLVKKGQEYDLLVPQQKALYDVLFVSIARKEVELASENPPHPSSMIHYATMMGADGQSVLITIHPIEPNMPEAGTDEKA